EVRNRGRCPPLICVADHPKSLTARHHNSIGMTLAQLPAWLLRVGRILALIPSPCSRDRAVAGTQLTLFPVPQNCGALSEFEPTDTSRLRLRDRRRSRAEREPEPAPVLFFP